MPDSPPAPRDLERIACDAARRGAEVVGAAYGRALAVASKSSPTDVVTRTDLRAEAVIRNHLTAATPGAGMVGEEGGSSGPAARLMWVIDPLDGTVNFLYGVPLFAISVAAAVDGEVVAGAVLDVLRDELFSAHLGGGARCNDEPIAPSRCAALDQALVLTGFSYHAERRAAQGEIARDVLFRARDLRCFGSTALELCWVACGRADAAMLRVLTEGYRARLAGSHDLDGERFARWEAVSAVARMAEGVPRTVLVEVWASFTARGDYAAAG